MRQAHLSNSSVRRLKSGFAHQLHGKNNHLTASALVKDMLLGQIPISGDKLLTLEH